ncbi:hypothetical protein OXYTRIMIC_167 [Oxytricha trifallax]|uniref:Uncharacterized protein n=1 Tax=Oxytricha trifallax TaxID=1172189 RepID=A0A073I0F5_9SPIT|nr:hypothetical protein OXYTRIMIC_167 [Oxytricha trifallax]
MEKYWTKQDLLEVSPSQLFQEIKQAKETMKDLLNQYKAVFEQFEVFPEK